jgi:hypothetical protein
VTLTPTAKQLPVTLLQAFCSLQHPFASALSSPFFPYKKTPLDPACI